ncbi:MAG TPA: GNAT family N-acetyltransferase [Actinocrinis sp.]|jgi:GNAT superfamily N-acetyltransferase
MTDATLRADAEDASRGWFAAARVLTKAVPRAYERIGRGGVSLLYSGVPVPTVNGILTETTDPDPAEIAALARQLPGLKIPYSIQLRGELDTRTKAGASIGKTAAKYGLTLRYVEPLMIRRGKASPEAPEKAASSVRVTRAEDHARYAATMATAFEAPLDIMTMLTAPEILNAPGAVGYVAESGGEIVAVGFGLTTGDAVGIYNIATLREHRGRGYGRAITERAAADGMAAGARYVYLQSSEAGFDLYESMGFRVAERWTYLMVPGE